MIEQFKQKAYTQGIVDAIDRISDIYLVIFQFSLMMWMNYLMR